MSLKRTSSTTYGQVTIVQYHIENPDNPEETVCGMNQYRWFDDIEMFADVTITIEEAVSEPDNYAEIERCDICWRDEDWRILRYLGQYVVEFAY